MARLAASDRARAQRTLACTLAGLASLGGLLRAYPPQSSILYPVCPFRQLTGLLCPGCGATRALAALASGDLRAALDINALVVAAIVCVFLLASAAYVRALAGRQQLWPRIPGPALAAACLAALAFAVARNLR